MAAPRCPGRHLLLVLAASLAAAAASAAATSSPPPAAPTTTAAAATASLRGAASAATSSPAGGSDASAADEVADIGSSTASPEEPFTSEAWDVTAEAPANMTTDDEGDVDLEALEEELEPGNASALDFSTAQDWGGRRRQGSCYDYKCGGYRRGLACQCNAACKAYGNCCSDYRPRCTPHPVNLVTVYHQTSREIGKNILQTDFRAGRSGWCGGAIYFAKTPEATYSKAISPDSHTGFMIEAVVDVGLVWYEGATCGSMSKQRLERLGFDSVRFNPGDGDEVVVYDPRRIKSKREVPLPHH